MAPFSRKKTTFDYSITRQCLTCSHTFQGRYCSCCGEKVIEPNERTLWHFLGHVVSAFTSLDGKFWRSFKTMVSNPGKMSRDICEGRRQPYMLPLSFFLVANFIYFLFPILEVFTAPLDAQLFYMGYSSPLGLKELVESNIPNGVTYKEYAALYNAHSESTSKLILILLPVVFSLFTALLFAINKKLYVDHLNFSLEFMSFVLFIETIAVSFILYGVNLLSELTSTDLKWIINDRFLGPVYLIASLFFLFFGVKNFYRLNLWMGIGASLLLLMACFLTILIYRLILFFVTFWTL